MRKTNRLISVKDSNDKLVGLLTFFIGNGDVNKYVRDDSWSIIEDDPQGDTVYIDHLLSLGKVPKYSIEVWAYIKGYFKDNFSNIKKIRWNRFKNNKVRVFVKEVN